MSVLIRIKTFFEAEHTRLRHCYCMNIKTNVDLHLMVILMHLPPNILLLAESLTFLHA